MTLILTFAASGCVLQLSDRLVNVSGREYDPLSNKNLIYFARDAYVTIGYSGLAYVGEVPTDQWIAQELTGVTFAGPGERKGVRFGPRDRWLDLGQSAEALRSECAALYRGLPKSHRFLSPQIVIAGWHEGREVWRPIVWIIEYAEKKAAYDIVRTERWGWWERRQFVLNDVPYPGSLTRAESEDLREQLKRAFHSDTVEQLLVAAVRRVAQRDATVGPHCMSILLPSPAGTPQGGTPELRTRYLPLGEQKGVVEDERNRIEVPAAASPWVVGPQLIAPPGVMVGSGHQHLIGDFRVVMEAPEVPSGSGVLSAFSTDRRRPRPRP